VPIQTIKPSARFCEKWFAYGNFIEGEYNGPACLQLQKVMNAAQGWIGMPQ
jgi:hypothetical protein